MAHIILVHGLGATEKSWFDIPKFLNDAGHHVNAVLLPDGIQSGLDDFSASIKTAFPTTGKCILVGHSMGGVSISQAAADNPARVSSLIYVTALVPSAGESAGAIIGGLSVTFDSVSSEFSRLGISSDHPARRDPVFGALRGGFRPSSRFSSIPKHYVRCTEDRIVTPEEQTRMTKKWPVMDESILSSGHIPQKEKPDELSEALLRAIE